MVQDQDDKETMQKKSVWISLLIGGFIGTAIFLIAYGYRILDVSYDNWLRDYNEADMALPYNGWRFFRSSEWNWPLGLIENMTYPAKLSIMYTDSLPIIAIICKLFNGILPETFQYMGIYTLICFILQGALVALIVYKLTKDNFISAIASILLTCNSILFEKCLLQVGVGSNWLILAAYALYAYKDNLNYKKKVIWNLVLTFLTIGINMYYLPMVLGILCFMQIDLFLDEKSKKSFIRETSVILFDVIIGIVIIYALGGFEGKISATSSTFANSANLNTLFNSFGQTGWGWSPAFSCNYGQFSGYAYIGCAGIILLFMTLILMCIHRKYLWRCVGTKKKSIIIISIMFIIFFIYALSPQVYLGSKLLIDWPLPEMVIGLWHIFRTTGRFVYPVFYGILIISIVFLSILLKKKSVYLLLGLCVVLHLAEFSKIMESLNDTFFKKVWNGDSIYMKEQEFWKDIAEGKKELIFMPAHTRSNRAPVEVGGKGRCEEITFWAYDYGLKVNETYLARRDVESITAYREKQWEKIYGSEEIDTDVIYCFYDTVPTKCVQEHLLNIYYVDDYYIGIKEDIDIDKYDEVRKIEKLEEVNVLPKHGSYVQNAVYSEEGLLIHPGGNFEGMKLPLRKGEYRVEITGEGIKESEIRCDVKGIGNIDIDIEKVNSEKVVYRFKLDQDADIINFVYINSHEEDVLLNEILLTEIL